MATRIYEYETTSGHIAKFNIEKTWNGQTVPVISYSSHYNMHLTGTGYNTTFDYNIDDIYTERTDYDEDNLKIAAYIREVDNEIRVYMCTAYNYNDTAYTAGRLWFIGTYQYNQTSGIYDGDQAAYTFDYSLSGIHDSEWTFDANFPIFDSMENWENYITTGSLDGLLNDGTEYSEDTEDYYIYTSHKHASVKNGSIDWASGVATFSFERILAQRGSICLYRSAEPNVYRLRANLVVGSYYSSTSKPDVENADPADFAPGVRYSGPFYDVYNKSFGDGSFELALPTRDLYSKSTTNIPIFSDEEKADGYLDGTVPEEEAENYSYIANDFGDARNATGDLEDATQVGTNNSRGVFAVDYCMSRSGLASLGGDFFSETYLEDMKKGLELYGNNPMNSVLQCLYFPFDISSIYSVSGVEFVHFGSYNHPVSGYGINKVLFNTGLKDLGTTHILPTFRNFLDYTATEIYAYLPYIGWVNLDVNKYMDTDLNIKYAVDLHSGECTAMLFSNGRLMDCYDGQIGIKQPITSEDMSAYFMAQIQGIKGATGAVTGGAINGAGVGAKGGAYGAAAGAIVGGGLGAVNAGVTLYGLAKMRPQLFSSGGYSGALGANLPQYPIIVFCIHDCEEPVNLLQTHGKPSNKSGRIQDFSGFLSVNSVNLICGTATNDEKDEILSYLASGVII